MNHVDIVIEYRRQISSDTRHRNSGRIVRAKLTPRWSVRLRS